MSKLSLPGKNERASIYEPEFCSSVSAGAGPQPRVEDAGFSPKLPAWPLEAACITPQHTGCVIVTTVRSGVTEAFVTGRMSP